MWNDSVWTNVDRDDRILKMHYLITGHTGFKGSWLSLMLQMQGHTVSGISLNPLQKSLFIEAGLEGTFKQDLRIDIRDKNELSDAFEEINPDIVIHLAAQALVRESYKFPVETFETNVLGTLNVLKAMQGLANVKAGLIITTDKVYKNHNHLRGYVETDELGGDDPYSASKAAADIAAQSWIKSFATVPIAIARAGNVIGGGDWAVDRIIPDLVAAYSKGTLPTLRNPSAIRPWQHVLDCLNGYLKLIDHMLLTKSGGLWNFGPNHNTHYTVGDLAGVVADEYGITTQAWNLEISNQPHEAGYLLLDSTKSRNALGWQDLLDFEEAVIKTVEWYVGANSNSPLSVTQQQISDFFNSQ
jgi:CDP-glucose 4,6-dehydratase